jgi:uncharacterized membrane protein YfcA
MSLDVALAVALAVGVGFSLGLFGGGGSILAVPLLVYVAGLPGREAIATALLVVGATGTAGVIAHARMGRVQWRIGLLVGAAGMVGAYVGGRLAGFVPTSTLLLGFTVLMAVTAIAMIRGRRPGPQPPGAGSRTIAVVAVGVLVGLIAGLVGAGGGFLVVPALVLLGGLPMPAAIGTSLLVIALQSFAGLAGHLSATTLDWGLAVAVTAAAVSGGLIGAGIARRVRPDRLRSWFGWLVMAFATAMLGQQLPASSRPAAALAAAAVAIAVGWVAVVRKRTKRMPDRAISGANTPRRILVRTTYRRSE